ncbi:MULTISPECIES: sulfur carrier protein ThiS [Metabacillus]|jgi:sulfur carrier protein|uniref:Thiamine biosynthesis protein ThiS n=3 Tax=Metabacillus TaxID=2675233 RepID=A0A179SQ06_9BACI|nr:MULTISPECIES: sulfur carrier protein ThiS [Metabacillus]OAS83846.1 thiamine biosynthesis protein ThiS [Metabacillus litoralis]QNF28441.1 sulfur carrier protein ThiS [Metabacillus sp. KUDC1714]
MSIKLNGEIVELSGDIQTIQQLLAFYKLEDRLVIVEHNREIILKDQYESTDIQNGDEVELVHFVGGG